MFGEQWTWLKARLVEEVPDDMAACLDCQNLDCRVSRYETCPNRLSRAAVLRAMRSSQGLRTRTKGKPSPFSAGSRRRWD